MTCLSDRNHTVYHAKKAAVKQEIDKLLSMGILEPESPYASPIVVVPKKNGDVRVCEDFRKLNHFSKVDNYHQSQ